LIGRQSVADDLSRLVYLQSAQGDGDAASGAAAGGAVGIEGRLGDAQRPIGLFQREPLAGEAVLLFGSKPSDEVGKPPPCRAISESDGKSLTFSIPDALCLLREIRVVKIGRIDLRQQRT
jgi:hypothetical protein